MSASILHIHLQSGFTKDTVAILVNGQEVPNAQNVTSDPRLGWAKVSREIEIAAGEVIVEVAVPTRNVSGVHSFALARATWLGISILSTGKIHFRTSDLPFGYG